MKKSSLSLEDVLEDSPQTRCLVKVFEDDASKVHDYMNMVQSALQRLVTAQAEVTIAMQQLGTIFNAYSNQNFPLEISDTEFPSVVDKFQQTVSELSSWMEIVSQQLQNCVLYPVDKFVHEMNDLERRKEVFHSMADELDSSVLRHAKISRKADAVRKVEESSEELCAVRRRFHLAGLRYYVQLNNLQFTRRIALLEPVLSMLYAFRSFFNVGHQALSCEKDLGDFFTRTQEQLQSLHSDQENQSKKYNEFLKTVTEIERLQPDIYNVEAPLGSESEIATIAQKQGYLFLKSKSALQISKWDRQWFFTLNDSLMCQGRDELAGKLLFELEPGVQASITDNEDRRHTFVVNCPKLKKQFTFQAPSERDRNEWVGVINNSTKEGFVHDQQNTVKDPPRKSSVSSKENSAAATDTTPVYTAPMQFDMLSTSDETSSSTVEESLFDANQSFCVVKFLGSMEVVTDREERVAHDAIRQILSAREVHQISKSFQVKFVVSNSGDLGLLDSDTNRVRIAFSLDDVALWTVDPGDKTRLALVVRTKGGKADGRHKFTAYVFQSSSAAENEKVCAKLSEATKLAFQALVDKKTSSSSGDAAVSHAAAAHVADKPPNSEESKANHPTPPAAAEGAA